MDVPVLLNQHRYCFILGFVHEDGPVTTNGNEVNLTPAPVIVRWHPSKLWEGIHESSVNQGRFDRLNGYSCGLFAVDGG